MHELTQTAPKSPPARSGLLRLPWTIGVAIVGILTILIGIVLLPAPGPGSLVIYAGIGILATEFPWAQRLLAWIRDQAKKLFHIVWKKKPATKACCSTVDTGNHS